MAIRIKSKFVEYTLWLIMAGFLLWHIFISVVIMDPFAIIPTCLIIAVAVLLRLRHEYFGVALQLWAIYLVMSASLKLLAMYMQSNGSITYDWSTTSLYRNVFFLFLAGFLFFVSMRQVVVDERF